MSQRAAPERFISSSENPQYRFWRKLALAKPAAGAGALALLQGEHLCRAWLQLHGLPQTALVAEGLLAASLAIQDLWRACGAANRVVLQDRLAAALSQVQHGPAVFFVVALPQTPAPERLDQACLLLDRVQDPGNLGTLLRTAAAAGLRQAFLSPGCAAAWSPKVLRSGQGAHFALEIFEQQDFAQLLPRLAVPLVATSLQDAQPLYDADLRPASAWVFGNEGAGVADHLQRAAQLRVRIPQDSAVESLNVAAAAAICLFEQRRQQSLAQ